MNKTDEEIIKLKDIIAKKKSQIGKKLYFSPETSCILELDGRTYNLNVSDRNALSYLLVRLISLNDTSLKIEKSFKGFDPPLVLSGFEIGCWINDIASKLKIMDQRNEETKLKAYENKLDKLLSCDMKAQLEIAQIAKELEQEKIEQSN